MKTRQVGFKENKLFLNSNNHYYYKCNLEKEEACTTLTYNVYYLESFVIYTTLLLVKRFTN